MYIIQTAWAGLTDLFSPILQWLNDLLLMMKVPTIFVGGFTLNGLIILLCAALFLLAFYAIQRKRLSAKVVTVIVLLFAIPAFFVAMVEQLSRPKELSMAWLRAQGEMGISIDSVKVVPPTRIYLWMEMEGEQRNYYIPWSKGAEESLKKAMEKRKGRGARGGDLRLRFEPSLEMEPQFYELPWPAPPPKDGEGDGETPSPAPSRPFVIERDA